MSVGSGPPGAPAVTDPSLSSPRPGRRRRHHWSAAGRAHIEVRASRRRGSERFARELERALGRVKGVHWAEVNAVLGRVVVSFEEGAVNPDTLVDVVEGVEELHDVDDATFGFDRPDFPGDIEPLQRAVIALVADLVGAASGIAGALLSLPPVPGEVAALFSVLDSQPRLRRLVERAVGPVLADLGLTVTNAVAQGLAQGPLGSLLDAAHRAGLLDETIARRQCWAKLEPQLCGDPGCMHRLPVERTPRSRPLPSGPVEAYADGAGMAAIAGAVSALAVTSDPRRAASVLVAGLPKAGRLGREAFSQRLGRALSAHDEIVFDPAALRRLDRLDTVVIDSAVLFTGQTEVDRVELHGDVDRAQVHRRLRSLFDPREPDAVRRQRGWSLGPLRNGSGQRPGAFVQRAPAWATHGLTSTRGLMAAFNLRDELAHGWRHLVEAARSGGYMVAIAADDPSLVGRFEAHMLVAGRDQLASSVRMLQADGCGVLLVCGPNAPALEAADCSIGLALGGTPPWGADIVGKDLGTATFLVEAAVAARSVSNQSAELAALGSATAALVGLASPSGTATARALTAVNVAALAALANGLRAGVTVARRPRRRPMPAPPWHELDVDEALARLGTTRAGLSAPEQRPRLEPFSRAATRPARFVSAVATELANPLTPVLAGGAALAAAVGSSTDAVMVGGVSAFNALVGGTVRYRAETAVRSLDRASQQQVGVRRGRRREVVAADNLRLGDVVVLSAGDAIPADCRLIEAANLEVDESSLTGESLPVAKSPEPSFSNFVSERSSMLYAETSVVAGSATAVVVAVGDDTEAAAGEANFDAPVSVGAEARLGKLTALSVPLAGLGGAAVIGSDLVRGRPLATSLGHAVTLAVAAVPEGLPLVATMAQLAAARRLSRRGALVRNPRALEALARVDVLCTDKTGTLTGGRVVLTSVFDGRRRYSVAGLRGPGPHAVAAALRATSPARAGATAELMDRAIVDGARLCGVDERVAARGWKFQSELPFEPSRGFHATVGTIPGGYLMSVKGAPEVVLARCDRWVDEGRARPIDTRRRRYLEGRIEGLARTGLRVLAVAEGRRDNAAIEDGDVASLTFRGLLGLSDPVRPAAALAVKGLQDAGVEVVMVTGDHASTAESVAVELGLVNGHRLMTGAELSQLTDAELDRALPGVSVFARVAPADKVRIVAAFRRAGRTVAMTGDGANDAPAIRLADVGIALGRQSTTAARMAADIVVTDDRIETLLDAVTEGRGMWASVREAVGVLVGGNAGEVLFSAGTGLVVGRVPLSTRQLLLVNLMTDVVPSLAIAVQPPPRRSPAQLRAEGPERSLGSALYESIAERAVTTAAGAGAAWAIATVTGRKSRASTVALAALVGTQLGQTVLAGRADPLVIAASAGSAGLLAAIIETPGLSHMFGCTPIGPLGWATAVGSAAATTGASWLISPSRRREDSRAPGAASQVRKNQTGKRGRE